MTTFKRLSIPFTIIAIILLSCIGNVLSAIPSTTNWDSIDPNILINFPTSLPKPPTSYLNSDWSSFGSNPFVEFVLDSSKFVAGRCGQSLNSSATFPQQGIEYGSQQLDGTNQFCRVALTGNTLTFYNKRQPANTIPVSANPTWVQYRFPVPQNKADLGIPLQIRINLEPRRGNGYQMTSFGGNPCTNGTTPECLLNIEGPWSRAAKGGYYVLMTTPNAGGYMILGPFTNDPQLLMPVPAEFKDPSIKEIDIVIFTFNTYPYNTSCPAGQPIANCYIYEQKSISVLSVSIVNGLEFVYKTLPVTTHPRIYGNDATFWDKKVKPYYELACDNAAPGGMGIQNIRDSWEFIVFGGSTCKNNRASSLRNHPLAKKYFDGTVTYDQYNQYQNGLNVMYTIRFLRSCYSLGRSDCVFSQSDLNALVPLFISTELSFWSNWGKWYDGYGAGDYTFGFDLGSKGPSRYWSIFYDLFYNDLTSTQRQMIEYKLDDMTWNYIRSFNNRDWNIWNGNNWTPVLSSGAIYLSMARWSENATSAQTLMTDILSVMYRTRYTIEADGVFVEGLAHYTAMNMDNIIEMDEAINIIFGIHMYSPRWAYFENSYKWILNAVLVDGLTMDFGDSHITQYGSLTPLFSMYIKEMIEYGTPSVDPCAVAQFWINNYFGSGLNLGFDFRAMLARNWTGIVNQCTTGLTDTTAIFPIGGNGMFRRRVANSGAPITSRQQLLDFTSLAHEAKYNGYPHTESDFGGIIWSGAGSRLISDMSYGMIAKDDKTVNLDNGGGGASTLVIEDAWDATKPTIINRGQFSPIRGSISQYKLTVDGTSFDYFKLDGSDVYGRNRTADGWLKRMFRYSIALPGGHYVIVDSFTKHDRLASIRASEYFYTNRVPGAIGNCNMWAFNTVPSIVNNNLELRPSCNNIKNNYDASTTVGRVVGASLASNTAFVVDGNITFDSAGPINTVFRSRYSQSAPITAPEARAFLLTAAATQSALPTTSTITKLSSCLSGKQCFEIVVNTASYRVELSSDTDGLFFDCIRPKVGGSYSSGPCTSDGQTTSPTGATISTTTGASTTYSATTTGISSTTTGISSSSTLELSFIMIIFITITLISLI